MYFYVFQTNLIYLIKESSQTRIQASLLNKTKEKSEDLEF